MLSNPSTETSSRLSTQLWLYTNKQKKISIGFRQLGSRSITKERLLALRTTCWIQFSKPNLFLRRSLRPSRTYTALPILEKKRSTLSHRIEGPLMARYIPSTKAIVLSLPLHRQPVDDKYILPVCPMVMDVYNSQSKQRQNCSLYEIGGELGSSKPPQTKQNRSTSAEESTESVDLHLTRDRRSWSGRSLVPLFQQHNPCLMSDTPQETNVSKLQLS